MNLSPSSPTTLQKCVAVPASPETLPCILFSQYFAALRMLFTDAKCNANETQQSTISLVCQILFILLVDFWFYMVLKLPSPV